MEKFSPDDFCHYNVGSDTYALVVVKVSPNGKTVWASPVEFTSNVNQCQERVTEKDIKSWKQGTEVKVFRSRKGGPHKEPGHYGVQLHRGFSSYRDPSF